MFSVIRRANAHTGGIRRISILRLAAIAGVALVALPAGAQALGAQHRAYTEITRAGVGAGTTVNGSTAFSSEAQYSRQSSLLGPSVNASSDDSHGGTVTATATMVYDSRLDNPVPPATTVSYLRAEANAIYRFSLDGPSSTAWVPVVLKASGSATRDASASFSFVDSEGEYYGDAFDTFGVGTPGDYSGGTFDVNRLLYLKTGRVYLIAMSAVASSDWYKVSQHNVVDEAGAWVDPILTVQGDFAQDYHLVGLPASAIGGVAAVPEPASWAMMVGGFGLVGSAMRRRRARICFA